MESSTSSPASPEEQTLIHKYLGIDGVIINQDYKSTALLRETEAQTMKGLISDVDYTFSLALNHGDYYLG
jgi:hypothetical protein